MRKARKLVGSVVRSLAIAGMLGSAFSCRTQADCLKQLKGSVVSVDKAGRVNLKGGKKLKDGDTVCRSTVLVRVRPLAESIQGTYEVGFVPGNTTFAPPHAGRTFFDGVPESEVVKVQVPGYKK